VVWRLYPFAVFAGLVVGSLTAAVLGGLGGFAAVYAGLEDIPRALLTRADVAAAVVLITSVSAFVAGYAAARLSPGEELVNATTTGAVFLVVGLAEYAQPSAVELPLWLHVVSLTLVIPCALLGGFVFRGREPAA